MQCNDFCCARAFDVGHPHQHKDYSMESKREYKNLRNGYPVKEKRAQELQELVCVPLGECGLRELELFQIILSEYQIVTVSARLGNSIIFSGPDCDRQLIYHCVLIILTNTGLEKMVDQVHMT